MRGHTSRTVGIAGALAGLALSGCIADNRTSDDGGPKPPANLTCGALTVTVGSAPANVFAYPVGDSYGLNAFYFWEVTAAGDPASPTYKFSDGSAVTTQVPRENWQIPPTTWSAVRLGLDGLDPYHFSVDDPFVLGYLPYTAGASWQSKHGAHNDGSCPGSNTQSGGFDTCIGKNQADPSAPKTLTSGHAYLLRMAMIIPLGQTGDVLQNRVQSCYQQLVVQP